MNLVLGTTVTLADFRDNSLASLIVKMVVLRHHLVPQTEPLSL